MRYCACCTLPDTKPDLKLDEQGICSACRSYENRSEVDWSTREKELDSILDRHRSNDDETWDCIVPVSGGKDSTAQVIKMLQLGMNPLCVTSTTCDLSEVGRRNIENIKQLGVDYVEFTPNPIIRRKLNRIGLTQVGDISWPEHAGIFTIPVRAAVQFRVPLIIWGENPQNEYGGPAQASDNNVLTRRWLEEFGGLLGLRVTDLVGLEGIEKKHLLPYTYPSDEALADVGVTGLFLGYYMPWDGYANALLASAHGFESTPHTVVGSVVNYENLDNHHTGIHDYFKFLKFGFGRATDIASTHIRRGRISRLDGLELVRKHDGKFPWTYLGKSIEDILEPLDLTVDEFIKICDRFTNKRLFQTDSQGNLIKDNKGNLKKIRDDNENLVASAILQRSRKVKSDVVVVDYGLGNLKSVGRALEECGAEVTRSSDPETIGNASRLLLPGVGAFSEAMRRLAETGLDEAIRSAVKRKASLLGVCLGMQLLADEGDEGGTTRGLGLIPGRVRRMTPLQEADRMPHVGWNELAIKNDSAILGGIPNGSDFYFVHSYQMVPKNANHIVATTTYGSELVSVVQSESVCGLQFHPEKSQRFGLRILRNFIEN